MSTRPDRETAYRVFAAEFDDATLSYAESDEERAPNYVVTPTGARVNRLFAVGVLTEIESVNEEQLRARVVDPTGAFVVYAGQYQPEALSFLERTDAPAFVAVTGKARTFQPEDSSRVFTSVRPETLSEVDAATRDRFVVAAAERTLERVRTMEDTLARDERGDVLREALSAAGVERGLAAGVPRALDHYGTTPSYLNAAREMALDAARVVAGEREEVPSLDVAPGEGGTTDRTAPDSGATGTEPAASTTEPGTETEPESGTAAAGGTTTAEDAEPTAGSEPTAGVEGGTGSEPSTETDAAPESDESVAADSTAEPERSDTEPRDESGVDEPLEAAEPADGTAEPEASSGESDVSAAAEVDPGDSEEFELAAEERERIEDEYGTDFESAAEVDGPGEADIETPTPDDRAESDERPEPTGETVAETADTSAETRTANEPPTAEATETAGTETAGTGTVGTDATEGTETTDAAEPTADDTETVETDESAGDEAGDADPETAVVAAMRALDDGDGADREAVIERVVEEHGLTRDDAAEGIQDALMSGECYESGDEAYTPI